MDEKNRNPFRTTWMLMIPRKMPTTNGFNHGLFVAGSYGHGLHNLWRSHFGVDEHPFATGFDVHQGYRVLTHSHMILWTDEIHFAPPKKPWLLMSPL